MSTTDNILRDLVEAVQNLSKPKTSAYDTTATVTRIEDGIAWCHIDGGVQETPVRLTIDAKAGDTVQVRVGGGSAWLTGNSSAPPTDDTKAKEAIQQAQQAAGTATKFVTDTKDGIFVHPKDDKDTGVRIQNTVEIVRGGESVAEYGEETRIGKNDTGHLVVTAHGVKHINGSDTPVEMGVDAQTGIPVVVFGIDNTYSIADPNVSGNPVGPVFVAGVNNIVNDAFVDILALGHDNTVEGAGVTIGDRNAVDNGYAIGTGLLADWGKNHGGIAVPLDGLPFVIGCWNKIYNDMGENAFTIGGGSGDAYRDDIFNVRWDGALNVIGKMMSNRAAMFVTDSITYDNPNGQGAARGISISAGGNSGSLSISVSKTGYTPIAVKGLRLNNSSATGGTGAATCCAYAWALGSSALSIAIHNHGDSAAKIKVIIDVLYMATSAL